MGKDGLIAYWEFSDQELLEAADSIDQVRYPLNFGNLSSEIARRPEIKRGKSANRHVEQDLRGKRTLLVWLITAFLAAGLILFAFVIAAFYFQRIELPSKQRIFFE